MNVVQRYSNHINLFGIIFFFQPTTKLFIDGKFVESKTNKWIDLHNPVRIAFDATCTQRFSGKV